MLSRHGRQAAPYRNHIIPIAILTTYTNPAPPPFPALPNPKHTC